MAHQPLGSVLVIGGCGFLGYELVCLLTKESKCSVSVLSRSPREPRVNGVSYYQCDITDINLLRSLILEIKPCVIIDTASPVFFQDEVDNSSLHQVNVIGTRNMLEIATKIKSIQGFVYTSSCAVHTSSGTHFLTEDAPLVDRSTSSEEYAITKAIADAMVLKANFPELRTLCLRPPAIYGERDKQLLPGVIAGLQAKRNHIQLGDNTNLWDAIYVGNAALAHVIATKALLRADSISKVDGEAFFITDDAPMPFWDFQRKVWAAAGVSTPLIEIYIIPAWLGMALAASIEYLFWFFSLGRVLPPKGFRRSVLSYALTERTYCIDKAKQRLEYRPLVDTDEGIRRGVEWTLRH
ncbi:MAG: erg26, C-3 sterol dehydrogenase [Candelina mexicana]|nr:MAG: erg26, C-3 sterol dehydrogenase [Candelina mexicana]